MLNDDVKKQRDAARAELKKEIIEAEGTTVQVAEEGLLHIATNWDNDNNPFFAKDYVMVMYGGFFGHHKMTGKPKPIFEAIVRGNYHELSHHIAKLMKEDKAFCVCMLHAMEVWAVDSME